MRKRAGPVLTETERQFYLAHAGIRLWYARAPLPGAAPSPEFEFLPEAEAEAWPAPDESRVPDPPIPELSAPAPAGPPPQLRALIAGSDQAADSDSEAAATADVSGGQAGESGEAGVRGESGAAPAVRPLTLQVWAGERFALVADISADTSVKLQHNLACNILASIGEKAPCSIGPAHWPVFNNLAVAGSRTEDLLAIVRDLLARVDGRSLLLMGLSDTDSAEGNGDWFSRVGDYDVALQFPHTLAALAGQPDLKSSLWDRLRTLVVR